MSFHSEVSPFYQTWDAVTVTQVTRWEVSLSRIHLHRAVSHYHSAIEIKGALACLYFLQTNHSRVGGGHRAQDAAVEGPSAPRTITIAIQRYMKLVLSGWHSPHRDENDNNYSVGIILRAL